MDDLPHRSSHKDDDLYYRLYATTPVSAESSTIHNYLIMSEILLLRSFSCKFSFSAPLALILRLKLNAKEELSRCQMGMDKMFKILKN